MALTSFGCRQLPFPEAVRLYSHHLTSLQAAAMGRAHPSNAPLTRNPLLQCKQHSKGRVEPGGVPKDHYSMFLCKVLYCTWEPSQERHRILEQLIAPSWPGEGGRREGGTPHIK